MLAFFGAKLLFNYVFIDLSINHLHFINYESTNLSMHFIDLILELH